ncbi:hypothetical protein ACX3UJ_07955 [Actinotignum schaalii]
MNLRDQGGAAEREEATWYPSEARAYEELLDTITAEVHGNVKGESSSYALREAAISHLMDYCFDDAVEHGKTLMSQAVYQILMRLDGVDLEDSNQPVVYGSPIAVARVPGIVPGRYCTGKHPQQIDGVDATAVWNGKEWEKPRWRDHRDPRAMSRNPLTGLPALPNEAPTSITNLISLSLN